MKKEGEIMDKYRWKESTLLPTDSFLYYQGDLIFEDCTFLGNGVFHFDTDHKIEFKNCNFFDYQISLFNNGNGTIQIDGIGHTKETEKPLFISADNIVIENLNMDAAIIPNHGLEIVGEQVEFNNVQIKNPTSHYKTNWLISTNDLRIQNTVIDGVELFCDFTSFHDDTKIKMQVQNSNLTFNLKKSEDYLDLLRVNNSNLYFNRKYRKYKKELKVKKLVIDKKSDFADLSMKEYKEMRKLLNALKQVEIKKEVVSEKCR